MMRYFSEVEFANETNIQFGLQQVFNSLINDKELPVKVWGGGGGGGRGRRGGGANLLLPPPLPPLSGVSSTPLLSIRVHLSP